MARSTMRPALRTTVAAVAVATTLLVAGPAVAATRAPAVPTLPNASRTALRAPGTVSGRAQLARGVTFWRDGFWTGGQPERASLLTVDLTQPGVRLTAATAGNALNTYYETIPDMARRLHATGGINADWFDLYADTGTPQGGVVINGQVVKTPQPGYERNFYVTAKGVAGIGATPFVATVTSSRKMSHAIAAVNDLPGQNSDALALITPKFQDPGLPRCPTVFGHTRGTARVVDRVRQVPGLFPALTGSQWVLSGCGRSGQWLTSSLHAGDRIAISVSFTGGPLQTLVSGGSVLVKTGRAYADPHGLTVWPGPNPETFVCTSRSGTTVTMGVIDGRSWQSAGVTFRQLTAYLLQLGCWSGLVLDGGGSSTLVARPAGSSVVQVKNEPSDYEGPRYVEDGLFVLTP